MKKRKNLFGLAGLILLLLCNPAYALVAYNDGGTHTINTSVTSFSIDDGFPGQGTTVEIVTGGFVMEVYAYEDSIFKQSGGEFPRIYLNDNSTGFIDGGRQDRIALFDNSTLTIYNTAYQSALSIMDTAEVILYGSDFVVNGQSVSKGTYLLSELLPVGGECPLAGHFENGTIFSYWLLGDSTAQLTLVPEPTTVVFGLLGFVLLRRKKSNFKEKESNDE